MEENHAHKRYINEISNDMLKNTAVLVHSRHRSVNNFIMNMVAALVVDRLFDKFCSRHHVNKSQTHRVEVRQAFIGYTKKKRKGKKLISKTKLTQIRCLRANIQFFLNFLD